MADVLHPIGQRVADDRDVVPLFELECRPVGGQQAVASQQVGMQANARPAERAR